MLNWDHFRYMIAIADNGSVAKAALALGVSHATVLRVVAKLEGELQLRLFDPATTGYRLTADGDDILINARAMHTTAQQILRKAKSRDAVPSGQLNIAIPDGTLVDLMQPLRAFCGRFDKITLNSCRAAISKPQDFIEQQIDVLLLISNNPPEALVGRQLTHIQLGAYTLAGNSLNDSFQNDKPLSSSQHRSNPANYSSRNINANRSPGQHDSEHSPSEHSASDHWVTWSQSADPGDELLLLQQQSLLQRHAPSTVVLQTSSHGDALAAVRAGLGAAVLSRAAAGDTLQEIPLPLQTRDWGLWVLTHPNFRQAARVTALMRFLGEYFGSGGRPKAM